MNIFNKKTSNRGFTLIELLVTISVLAILVLLGAPRLLNYTQKAELTRIQHDTKVMENEMEILMLEKEVDIGNWKNNNRNFNQLIVEDKLFEKEGVAEKVYTNHLTHNGVLNLSKYFREITSSNTTASLSDNELGIGGESYPVNELPEDFSVDKTYKVIPEEYSKKINTKLKGTFYVNSDSKVYYEHGKPIPGEDKDKLITCPTALPDYKFDHETGTIVDWYGTEQYLTIPSHFLVDGECWPVRIIGVGAFMRGNFRRVVIPDTVVRIERDAFKDATIDEIVIPHSVQHIAVGAFSGGGVDKVEVIGEPGRFEPGVFVGTEPTYRRPTPQELGIVIHPESGTIISSTSSSVSSTSSSVSSRTGTGSGGTLVIPDKIKIPGRDEPIIIKNIHKGAFQGEGLIEVYLPYTLERIEAYAFAGNQLNGISIPESVVYIGEYAFAFNQQIHSKSNEVRATIKTIIIKGKERIGSVKKGDIVDSSGSLASPLDGVEMKEYIWVTDADNFKFEVIGPEKPGTPVDPGNPAKPREPIGEEIAIDSADELAKIGTSSEYPLNGKYILTANIDLSHIGNWAPIGNGNSRFTGSFDGNGYKITNLTINRPSRYLHYVGFFGYTDGSTIRNVALEDINVTGSSGSYGAPRVGGLVGEARDSTIENSYATGSVRSSGLTSAYAGGLASGIYSGTTISNSHFTGEVRATASDRSSDEKAGGLVGYAGASTIENSYSEGSVAATASQSDRHVGGLVGGSGNITISNSYSTASVTATGSQGNRHAGGLVGDANGGTINNSYATGSVKGSGSYGYSRVGGLVGSAKEVSISNSYWDIETTGRSTSGSAGGGSGKTTEEMKLKESYEGWNFVNVWNIANGKYPTLR